MWILFCLLLVVVGWGGVFLPLCDLMLVFFFSVYFRIICGCATFCDLCYIVF
jgi:hypothetical protein